MKKSLIFLFLILYICANVSASVSVTPARYEIDFIPNSKQVIPFNFATNQDLEFEVYSEGDLAKYVTLDKQTLIGGGAVLALIEFPAEIEIPGVHLLYIGARQRAKTGATVAITYNVRGLIKVKVPYPGEYAEMEFSTSNANANENVKFSLKVYNLGKASLTTNNYIDIYTSDTEKIERIDLGTKELMPSTDVVMTAELGTKDYKAGDYKAVAVVEYSDKSIKSEKAFRLGELYIAVIDTTNNFIKNKINLMGINIESFWNDPIENVYANISILNSDITFLTPSIRLEPWQKSSLSGFFDTTNLNSNSFKAKIILNYNNKTTEKIVDLKIKSEINYSIVILVAVILVLVIALIALTIWINKISKSIRKNIK